MGKPSAALEAAGKKLAEVGVGGGRPKPGTVRGYRAGKPGEWYSSSRDVAGTYGKNTTAFDLDLGPKTIELDANGASWRRVPAASLPRDVDLHIRNANPEMAGNARFSTDAIAAGAKARGYDGVTLRNVFDRADVDGVGNDATSFAVFDPKRATAAWEATPTLLKNLAVPGAAAGLLALGATQDEAEAAPATKFARFNEAGFARAARNEWKTEEAYAARREKARKGLLGQMQLDAHTARPPTVGALGAGGELFRRDSGRGLSFADMPNTDAPLINPVKAFGPPMAAGGLLGLAAASPVAKEFISDQKQRARESGWNGEARMRALWDRLPAEQVMEPLGVDYGRPELRDDPLFRAQHVRVPATVDATEIGRLLSGEANTKREAPPLINWLEKSAEQSEQIGARLNLPALGAAGALIPGTLAGAYRDPLGMLDPTMVGLEGVRASFKKNPKLFWDGVTQGFGL